MKQTTHLLFCEADYPPVVLWNRLLTCCSVKQTTHLFLCEADNSPVVLWRRLLTCCFVKQTTHLLFCEADYSPVAMWSRLLTCCSDPARSMPVGTGSSPSDRQASTPGPQQAWPTWSSCHTTDQCCNSPTDHLTSCHTTDQCCNSPTDHLPYNRPVM